MQIQYHQYVNLKNILLADKRIFMSKTDIDLVIKKLNNLGKFAILIKLNRKKVDNKY